MTPGGLILPDQLPKCNGRPQFWVTEMYSYNRMRIIYPDGRVSYADVEVVGSFHSEWIFKGCTSRRSQEAAQKACINYGHTADCSTYFMGYL